MRAIGFSVLPKRKEVYNLIEEGVRQPHARSYTTSDEDEDSLLAQFEIELGDGIGISVCGQFDESDQFYPEYYYPYLDTDIISTGEEVTVDRRIDTDSYAGICDDLRIGVTLIFRLRNCVEYLKNTHKHFQPLDNATCSLSALSIEGMVMMPLFKSDADKKKKKDTELKRGQLLNAARNGDENAIRDLTVADMDVYANIMSHIQYEDIYTLVESYFMPYGAECDLYSVLGEIRAIQSVTNRVTQEEVLIMTLDINGLYLSVCINRQDLYGEPEPGRRFKGVIWLQGKINFLIEDNSISGQISEIHDVN
jgi:hypothetical protein